jgi:hypothetical protein
MIRPPWPPTSYVVIDLGTLGGESILKAAGLACSDEGRIKGRRRIFLVGGAGGVHSQRLACEAVLTCGASIRLLWITRTAGITSGRSVAVPHAPAYCLRSSAAMACPSGRVGEQLERHADKHRFPMRIRPGDRPPVQRFANRPLNVELLQALEGRSGNWAALRLSGEPWIKTMSKEHRSKPSSSTHPVEISYLVRAYGITRDQARRLIRRIGNNRAKLGEAARILKARLPLRAVP